jgi:hypothetical protein
MLHARIQSCSVFTADQLEYNEFCRRGQKQQKSSDACAEMPETRAMVRKVTGRLIGLPASLHKREFE